MRDLTWNYKQGVCPGCGESGCLEFDCEESCFDGDYYIFPFVCKKCGLKGIERNSLLFAGNKEVDKQLKSLKEDNLKNGMETDTLSD